VGFKKKNVSQKIKPVNLGYIEQQLEKLLNKKLIELKGDSYEIDLAKIGYTKLLGTGKVTKKLNIKVDVASPRAIKKIQEMGGQVTTLAQKASLSS